MIKQVCDYRNHLEESSDPLIMILLLKNDFFVLSVYVCYLLLGLGEFGLLLNHHVCPVTLAALAVYFPI